MVKKIIRFTSVASIAILVLGICGVSFSQETHSPNEDTQVREQSSDLAGRGGGGSSSRGGQQKSMHIGAPIGMARISYPNTPRYDVEEPAQLIPMAKPRQQLHDGAYLWKRNNGRYVLSWSGMSTSDISGTITSAREISVYKASDSGVLEEVSKASVLYLSDILVVGINFIEFATMEKTVDFDISINGVHDPRRIYIGAKSRNPASIPFRLEEDLSSIKTGETMRQGISGPDRADRNLDSMQPSGRSSGGGGSGVGKKKKK